MMAASLALPLLAAALQIGVEAILHNASFVSQGGDSITALRFSMECRRHKILIPVDAILSSLSIAQLLQQCLKEEVETTTCPMGEVICPSDHSPRSNKRARKNSIESFREKTNLERIKRPRPMLPLDLELFKRRSGPSFASHEGLDLVAMEKEELCCSSGIVHKMSETQISLVHGSVESPSANVIYYGETHRPTYMARLKAAWKQVCKAEPIFSTTYSNPGDGRPIRPQLHWRELRTSKRAVYEDARLAASGPDLLWLDESDDEIVTAFPVGFAAMRFTELRYEASSPADSQTTLIWAIHHALVDGWSAELLIRKVHMVASGKVVQPGPSFADVCIAQQQLRLSRKAEGDLFWAQQQEKLATARDELLLAKPSPDPVDATSPSSGGDQNQLVVTLDPADHVALKAAAQSCSVTTAALFYAAWAVCLGLYTDSDNVVVGTVVSARNVPLPGIFETVGPMINMLPLQVDLDWEAPARELVTDVYGRMQRLSQYSWTTPDAGFTRVRGNFMAMAPDVQSWSDVSNSSRMGPSFFKNTTNLPLSAIVRDDGGSMVLQYSSQHYTRKSMETLASLFKASLMSLCQLEASLESANLVSRTCFESLATVGNWHSGATSSPSITDDLVTLFERAASKWPSSCAIECGNRQITYAELERLSGEVSRSLTGLIQHQEVVAVHADGSTNWIISIYGILRAGGVYCPLDKAHPQDYRDGLFESSTARLFLATSTGAIAARPAAAAAVLDVEALLDGRITPTPSSPAFASRVRPQPQDRAYLCFTSGSTGKPKGVMCTHQGLVAFQSDLEVRLFAKVGTKVAQTMSVAFDGAIHEVFSALCYGATLVLRQAGEGAGLDHLRAADSAILTPSLASALNPDDFPLLKTVYLVGEAVPQTVCDTWAASKALYNMYGPTEATCGATITRLHPGQPVTIGRPNPTTRIYILDHRQRLAPPGRMGEIYLAGVQVAQGYIGRPEITAERFLPDPFCRAGEFMYKTGDRGYWDAAGEIAFCGRADRQIKLRGFRIDLEDLEARVLRAVSEAGAVAITNRGDDLVCMIQSDSTDVSGMQSTIRKALPAFAVPRYISVARRLPMTPNMKVDYREIAAQAGADNITALQKDQENLDVFQTKTEVVIASVWSQVLDAAVTSVPIGPSSNFAQLGGHSLQQLRLAARLKAMFGPQVTMRMISSMPTLRDLAAAIDRIDKAQVSPCSPSSSEDSSSDDSNSQLGQEADLEEPSPLEKDWYYKVQLKRGSSAFNVTWVARLDSKMVCPSRMAEAWNTVLARHVFFRVRYVQNHKHGLRRVVDASAPQVERRCCFDVREEVNRTFDLAGEHPVRVIMTDDSILAVWSHIVCDYTTLSLVLSEVAAAYHGSVLPPPIQPSYQRTPADPLCLRFWSRYLGDVKHRRPAYLSNGAERTSYGGQSLTGLVSMRLWHRMQNRARQSGVTLQQLLVAACAVALGAEDDKLDITLGAPFINRHSDADMNAVGLFLEPLPVRVHHDRETASLASYITHVQASAQRSLSHAVPWDQLLEHLGVDGRAQLPNHPLFDCVASFHDSRRRHGSQQEEGGPWSSAAWRRGGVEPQLAWSDGAKFKLMVECLAYDDDTLLLRLEYDGDCYGEDEGRITAVRRMILAAADAISSRDELTLGELRRELRARWRAERDSGFLKENEADGELLEDSKELFLQCFSRISQSLVQI